MNDVLSEILEDLTDEEFRSSVIDAVAKRLPLPDFVERRILEVAWEYGVQRLRRVVNSNGG